MSVHTCGFNKQKTQLFGARCESWMIQSAGWSWVILPRWCFTKRNEVYNCSVQQIDQWKELVRSRRGISRFYNRWKVFILFCFSPFLPPWSWRTKMRENFWRAANGQQDRDEDQKTWSSPQAGRESFCHVDVLRNATKATTARYNKSINEKSWFDPDVAFPDFTTVETFSFCFVFHHFCRHEVDERKWEKISGQRWTANKIVTKTKKHDPVRRLVVSHFATLMFYETPRRLQLLGTTNRSMKRAGSIPTWHFQIFTTVEMLSFCFVFHHFCRHELDKRKWEKIPGIMGRKRAADGRQDGD